MSGEKVLGITILFLLCLVLFVVLTNPTEAELKSKNCCTHCGDK